MNNENLRKEAANRVRRAVVAEAYDEVPAALADYRREVEAVVAAWCEPDPPPLGVVREAMDLTNWALLEVRSARARTGDKLKQASAVLQYHKTASPTPHWKLEG
jgi:hypothetical protein